MTNVATNVQEADALELTIEREFPHSVEAVFKAWTDQGALRRWIGPGHVRAPEAEMDARVGGRFVWPMIEENGTKHVARGQILELIPNQRLRFTMAWDQETGGSGKIMQVTLDFHATASGTRLVLHQTDFIDADARDSHEHGWQGSFDKLADFLSG